MFSTTIIQAQDYFAVKYDKLLVDGQIATNAKITVEINVGNTTDIVISAPYSDSERFYVISEVTTDYTYSGEEFQAVLVKSYKTKKEYYFAIYNSGHSALYDEKNKRTMTFFN